MHHAAASHLYDTPLSRDQVITSQEGGECVIVEATVNDSDRLEWWIRGLGIWQSGYRTRRSRRRMAGRNQENNHLEAPVEIYLIHDNRYCICASYFVNSIYHQSIRYEPLKFSSTRRLLI